MELQYKKCTSAELKDLITLSKQTFKDAFEIHNNPDDFKMYIENAFNETNMKGQLENLATHFYFVLYNNKVIGYFKLNEKGAQSDLNLENTIELERIYVIKQAQGQGFGTKILDYIIDYSKSQKIEKVWLGVWEKNEAAIKLYERYGFKKFGSHPYWLGNDKQTDFLMKFEL
ncbi:GNAT family N-acetyltransferase [Spongiivirga sp. MCCC 1A20706]|uniref:GNAT family N-acetyltransferase n=1 Tax=Spongiivirga sp. MCCC 1A20706 TaxID=3160963 RepID=UPI0039779E9D